MISAIIAAAGKGTRMGASENKVFLKLEDKPILVHTAEAFINCPDIDEIIIVTGSADIKRCTELFSDCQKPVRVIEGGKTRQESVFNGIMASKGDIVAIHDGARALITPQLITEAVNGCRKYKAAALGVPAKDTVKIVSPEGFIVSTPNRDYTYNIQTPQVFDRELIVKAHKAGIKTAVTDDCALAELAGFCVMVVMGSYENIKVTTPEDLLLAGEILKARNKNSLL